MTETRATYSAPLPVNVSYTDLPLDVLKLARVIAHECAGQGSYVIELERSAYHSQSIDVTISRIDRVKCLKIGEDGQRR